jgi:hypothetical protein
MPRTCNDCKLAIYQDYGYSNYTVEGTNLICAGMYQVEFDNFYGKAEQAKFAEQCEHFVQSVDGPFTMDVDGEWSMQDMTPEQKETYDLYVTKGILKGVWG